MKTRLPVLILLFLSALFIIFFTGEIFASNTKPVGCDSLHDPYYLAPGDSKYYAFGNTIVKSRGLITYYRVFIPPGTVTVDLLHLGIGQQKAVARYKELPKGSPESSTAVYSERYRLSELDGKDQWVAESLQGILHIVDDGFSTPLGLSSGGWLYVKIGGGVSLDYDNEFLVKVDREKYNEWWNTYIHDQAGWDQYVENVEIYEDPINPSTRAVLSVTPSNHAVTNIAGTTMFNVSNTGTGTMSWTAEVVSDSNWLTIASGETGSDTGAITCAFEDNKSTSLRTGTIRVTASGASGSPVEMTVTQSPPQIDACTATINGNLLLHIPYLTYSNPPSKTLSLWADFVYEPNETSILFKLTSAGLIENPSFSCAASTLTGDMKIHIPEVLMRDVIFHLVNIEYIPNLSSEGNFMFRVTTVGTD